jgi:hypothetical protein
MDELNISSYQLKNSPQIIIDGGCIHVGPEIPIDWKEVNKNLPENKKGKGMYILSKIVDEIEILEKEDKELNKKAIEIGEELNKIISQRDKVQDSLYKKRLKILQIKEIYRIATLQFNRLRKQSSDISLTEKDTEEIDKWILRANSKDGLNDIINAIKELKKYYPNEVTRIYALVQKIIIEGPYNSKRKPGK